MLLGPGLLTWVLSWYMDLKPEGTLNTGPPQNKHFLEGAWQKVYTLCCTPLTSTFKPISLHVAIVIDAPMHQMYAVSSQELPKQST